MLYPPLLTHKKVAILGGGPVGLMTAVLLKRGTDLTVYERDASSQARISGGTLDLHHDTGQRALMAAGLLPHYYQLARPVDDRGADQHGNVLWENLPTETTRHERPEIDRPDLRHMTLAALERFPNQCT